MIFKSFATFPSYLHKSIQTVTKRVDKIQAKNLGGTATVTGLPEKLILERKVEELDMDRINDCICINGLDSRNNEGADELQVGEVIIYFPQDLKAHLVMTDGEGVDFRGFVWTYNILTRTQQWLKGEENLSEVVKHKKCLAIQNMY